MNGHLDNVQSDEFRAINFLKWQATVRETRHDISSTFVGNYVGLYPLLLH